MGTDCMTTALPPHDEQAEEAVLGSLLLILGGFAVIEFAVPSPLRAVPWVRVGGAVVSDIHGNFIINDGSATARDVLALIEVIRTTARAERGVELETEVEIVGED